MGSRWRWTGDLLPWATPRPPQDGDQKSSGGDLESLLASVKGIFTPGEAVCSAAKCIGMRGAALSQPAGLTLTTPAVALPPPGNGGSRGCSGLRDDAGAGGGGDGPDHRRPQVDFEIVQEVNFKPFTPCRGFGGK